ncbi:unnamed protein product [Chironomus riparius]|uniref:Uncharacterized protein n=1 Tax=Chironomus riparius TaxID=315576 RepID=A0A9N9RSP7_9DIPT|nr:unnamed protein product [Chironomus riparius]
MEFSEFMKSFPIRTDIFDDITYLQKHLRLIIKFHQKLSSKLYSTSLNQNNESTYPSKNFSAIREFMDDLESEMDDISREQKMLIDIVKKCMNQYNETLSKECNVKMDMDVAEGFISRALQYHYQKNNSIITPNNVKARMSEDELKQKYEEIRVKNESERALKQLMGLEKKSLIKTSPSASSVAAQERESLIKPNFRKPSSTSGRVEKKTVIAAKNTIVETRHAKIISKKQNAVQQGINGSRLNLLRALNNVKIEQTEQYSDFGDGVKYIRSDEDCSDQSSSDGPILDPEIDPLKITSTTRGKRRTSPASNASSERAFPPLPQEPPPKIDYTKEEFLSIFQLIVPQIAEEIKVQKTKRKRRNCFKNEKNDFHYGNFDLNEAAYRLRLCNNRRSILYSPNNKRK